MRSRRLVAIAIALAVASAFAIGVAEAQEPRAASSESSIDLTWNAPAGCADRATILQQVDRLRGAATGERFAAHANVTLDASGVWNLQITTIFADGSHGERQIQAESCKAAADATASILALALTTSAHATTNASQADAAAATDAAPPDADALAPLASEDAGAPSQHPARAEPPISIGPPEQGAPEPLTPPIPLHVYVGANFGGTTGDLPSLGLGAGGELGISYGALRVEAFGDYFAFARSRFSTPGGANFQLFSAGGRGCWSFSNVFSFGSVGPCAAFELGSMRGESFDVSRPSSGSALMAEGFLGVLGTVSFDKNRLIALRALLEIGADLQRPQFVLDGVGFVHQPAPVSGRGTFGIEVRF